MAYTLNHETQQDFSLSKRVKRGDVSVGDNCWIGACVFVREGLSIGDNVVIGAHSVVTRNVPSFCMVAGAPARVISKIAPANGIPKLLKKL
jgi:acetyltransferase-like isoleucine patch superfamily enzyme